jgi:hypothetical protein
MVLIGLIGKKSSGKTTASEFLCKKFDYVNYAFADPLKQICMILGAPRWAVYGTQEEKERIVPELGISGRQMMQRLGTELFRDLFPTILPDFILGKSKKIWIHLFEEKLKKTPNMVVSDVRFYDEAETIIRNGGILLRINRDVGNDDSHSSEQNLVLPVEWVTEIDNNTSVENLYKKLLVSIGK